MYNKPTNFMELLELQKVLDEKTSAERPNGFKPRPRTERDIRFALDDEFNEFMKELPDELNFKTWKQKEWSAERQLEEWCDCLFFILAEVNDYGRSTSSSKNWKRNWLVENELGLSKGNLMDFKNAIQNYVINGVILLYVKMSKKMNYSEQDIYDTYWIKWNKNMGRQNKDWSL